MSRSIVPLGNTDRVLSEFFQLDGGITPSGKQRKSYLLASQWDLLFLQSISVPEDHNFRSHSQFSRRVDDKHFLAELLLFTSAVDLIARIMHRNTPRESRSSNRKYFVGSARRWFGLTKTQSNILWVIRNQIVHMYSLNELSILAVAGGAPMTYIRSSKVWRINASALYTRLISAKNKSENYIKSKSLKTRNKYARYIYEHGFYYSQ
jgi:hypothetical protein